MSRRSFRGTAAFRGAVELTLLDSSRHEMGPSAYKSRRHDGVSSLHCGDYGLQPPQGASTLVPGQLMRRGDRSHDLTTFTTNRARMPKNGTTRNEHNCPQPGMARDRSATAPLKHDLPSRLSVSGWMRSLHVRDFRNWGSEAISAPTPAASETTPIVGNPSASVTAPVAASVMGHPSASVVATAPIDPSTSVVSASICPPAIRIVLRT